MYLLIFFKRSSEEYVAQCNGGKGAFKLFWQVKSIQKAKYEREYRDFAPFFLVN